MLIGYAKVSTQDQHLELQTDALEKAGCVKVFTDIASGAKTERNGLEEALAYLREGDILTVWKLDRDINNIYHRTLFIPSYDFLKIIEPFLGLPFVVI